MDSFDVFPSYNDSISQYGRIADDTASMVSGYTNGTRRTDLQSQLDAASAFDQLSISGGESGAVNGNGYGKGHMANSVGVLDNDEDLEGTMENGKGGGAVDLPPHACR